MQQDLIARIPHTLDNAEGTYQVLFMQYNLLVYLMYFAVFFLVLSLLIICVFLLLLNYHSYLVLHYPKTLGRLAEKKQFITLTIYGNAFGAFLNLCLLVQAITYLKSNYLPHNLGYICDMATSVS